MIINEIKAANLKAMKEKNINLRAIYSVLIAKYNQLEIENRQTDKEITNEDVVRIIQKTIAELNEELQSFEKVNNTEQINKLLEQKEVLSVYLPKMLTEQEILDEIKGLDDKSIPVVMSHFKTKFGTSADLKLVNQVLRSNFLKKVINF